MLLNATLHKKSNKYPNVELFSKLDMTHNTTKATIRLQKGIDDYDEIHIPDSVLVALFLGEGVLSEAAIQHIKESNSLMAYMEKDFLNEISSMVDDLSLEAYKMSKKQ